MKTIHSSKLLLLLSLGWMMSSCDGPGMGDSDRRERLIERFDRDGDGVLNEQERAKAREAREQRARRNSSKGARAHPKLTDEQKARVLQRFDADGDGVLSDQERAEARRALQQRRASRPQGTE